MNSRLFSLPVRSDNLSAYSTAASSSCIEHGPTITTKRSLSPLIACWSWILPSRTVCSIGAVAGNLSVNSDGGSSGTILWILTSRVDVFCIDKSFLATIGYTKKPQPIPIGDQMLRRLSSLRSGHCPFTGSVMAGEDSVKVRKQVQVRFIHRIQHMLHTGGVSRYSAERV